MLVLHSMPAITSAELTAGSWLTADAGGALHDGRPSRRAGFAWPGGLASIDHYVGVRLGYGPTRVRGFAALGLSVPAGTRIEWRGLQGEGYGGSTDDDFAREMPDGTRGLVAVADGFGVVDSGCELRIYNDCNGLPWAEPGAPVYIGEIFVGAGIELDLAGDWSEDFEDASQASRTRGSQLNTVRWSAFRVLNAPLIPAHVDQVRNKGLGDQDWVTLRSALAGDARCVAIPRWRIRGRLDRDSINATAIYGTGRIGAIRHVGGDYYSSSARFEEIPAG